MRKWISNVENIFLKNEFIFLLLYQLPHLKVTPSILTNPLSLPPNFGSLLTDPLLKIFDTVKNENSLLVIQELLKAPIPCYAEDLSKATLSNQISQASNEQDKLVGTTHSQSPFSFFLYLTLPCAFNQAQYTKAKFDSTNSANNEQAINVSY